MQLHVLTSCCGAAFLYTYVPRIIIYDRWNAIIEFITIGGNIKILRNKTADLTGGGK